MENNSPQFTSLSNFLFFSFFFLSSCFFGSSILFLLFSILLDCVSTSDSSSPTWSSSSCHSVPSISSPTLLGSASFAFLIFSCFSLSLPAFHPSMSIFSLGTLQRLNSDLEFKMSSPLCSILTASEICLVRGSAKDDISLNLNFGGASSSG